MYFQKQCTIYIKILYEYQTFDFARNLTSFCIILDILKQLINFSVIKKNVAYGFIHTYYSKAKFTKDNLMLYFSLFFAESDVLVVRLLFFNSLMCAHIFRGLYSYYGIYIEIFDVLRLSEC